ncbi:MAG: Gfo/Idh/MocA family oxidoreductase [Propionicimonas sp.]|uniref:Gfo/Idh/MocA family oxidoreductase n=1 Tax=Propionicimonas sp. TaxID=1955623 RepID=UPI002B2092E9|nr:Gfo/Idh/MocA family oxidoreductase [Propionicimonas sp.]MEA4945136.1 Gfo/Idh/MocA family oxidoreductase [Propionicimonas sp.]MEA5055116.1 Gfo/Idh/MocA family oxidoreductase [Propionicimonas sp.]
MRVITYGTFDLFHEGHRRLLERAKALGDHLIVGVTTENYDNSRGKLNVSQSLMERIRNVQDSGLADEIIIEEYEGQKIRDIQKYGIDIFAIGSDWLGEFDYLKDYCEVVYLERTKGVSSTQLRDQNAGVIRLGVIGSGRIAARFVAEARYVSGVDVRTVFSQHYARAQAFAERFELQHAAQTRDDLFGAVDAVYIASPHGTHYEHTAAALDAGIHVLCEKPMTLSRAQTEELFTRAREREVVLLEAVKTAFAPAFQRMVEVARSGSIGQIRSVDATFTKLVTGGRELESPDGGSISELATYPLLAVVKLLGTDYTTIRTQSLRPEDSEVELFSRIDISYPGAIASARTGLGVKAEGELIVAGTLGYVHVPAPWWLTEYFETRFENPAQNRKYYNTFDGDGLRYELAEFTQMIRGKNLESFKLRAAESLAIADIIERARAGAEFFG